MLISRVYCVDHKPDDNYVTDKLNLPCSWWNISPYVGTIIENIIFILLYYTRAQINNMILTKLFTSPMNK